MATSAPLCVTTTNDTLKTKEGELRHCGSMMIQTSCQWRSYVEQGKELETVVRESCSVAEMR